MLDFLAHIQYFHYRDLSSYYTGSLPNNQRKAASEMVSEAFNRSIASGAVSNYKT